MNRNLLPKVKIKTEANKNESDYQKKMVTKDLVIVVLFTTACTSVKTIRGYIVGFSLSIFDLKGF